MTARPDGLALQEMRLCRSKRLCTLFRVIRKDGTVLRFTDHGRRLTRYGETYEPVDLGGLSAERRESALRPGSQTAVGRVDGSNITYADMLTGQYRGARVEHFIVDWTMPESDYVEHHKIIRSVNWDGSSYKANLEGLAARLDRPVAGRFNGETSVTCPYVLGDPGTCKATGIGNMIAVGPAPTAETVVTATPISFVSSGAPLPDLSGQWVVMTSGPSDGVIRQIESNTTVEITLTEPFDPGRIPAGGNTWKSDVGAAVLSVEEPRRRVRFVVADIPAQEDDFYREGAVLWVTGLNTAVVSPIVGWTDSVREAELLFPTPFTISAGDKALVIVGCDGLKATCEVKFNNVVNFGGRDVYVPGPSKVLGQIE